MFKFTYAKNNLTVDYDGLQFFISESSLFRTVLGNGLILSLFFCSKIENF